MGQNSKIEWTHHTANFWWGCVEVSPGCDNCYAREWAKRCGHEVWGVNEPRWFTKSMFDNVLKWQKNAKAAGERHRVFCQSMSDIGEILPEKHPQRAQMTATRNRVFEELIPACPDLDFLVLTKRVGNIPKIVPPSWMQEGFPSNVWMMISVVNQEEADRDIPKLIQLPASVRGLSCEPLLGAIEFSDVTKRSDAVSQLGKKALDGIHWVIAGGESGSHARPMHPELPRSLRDQCQAVGVPFHFKQWGEWQHESQTTENLWAKFCADNNVRENVCLHTELGGYTYKVGTKAAGRLLDGKTWDEFPEVKP